MTNPVIKTFSEFLEEAKLNKDKVPVDKSVDKGEDVDGEDKTNDEDGKASPKK